MPNTVSAVRFPPGRRWSRAAAAAMSTAGPTSVDTLVVLHGLQRSPTNVTVTVRSVVATGISGSGGTVAVTGWNASVVNLQLLADTTTFAVQLDVVVENEHSFVS